ncbi:hypothetical protein SSTU70S_03668 [Stutzerimonas stutzeri]
MIAVWQGIGSFLGNYYIARVSLGLVHDLRVALFNNLLTLPNRYFDSHNSGHLHLAYHLQRDHGHRRRHRRHQGGDPRRHDRGLPVPRCCT